MEIFVWERRHEKGLSGRKLAELSGISKSTIYNIENGSTSPTLQQLRKIAIALGCRITDLYDDGYK